MDNMLNPKDCQAVVGPLVIQGFSNFLGLFQVMGWQTPNHGIYVLPKMFTNVPWKGSPICKEMNHLSTINFQGICDMLVFRGDKL